MSSIPDFSLLIDQIRVESMRADLYRSEEGLRIVRLFSKSLDAISVLSFMAKFYEEKAKARPPEPVKIIAEAIPPTLWSEE